jgi:hypothetical protein
MLFPVDGRFPQLTQQPVLDQKPSNGCRLAWAGRGSPRQATPEGILSLRLSGIDFEQDIERVALCDPSRPVAGGAALGFKIRPGTMIREEGRKVSTRKVQA